MDNFSIIYRILSTLEKSMDLEQCSVESISAKRLKISEERWCKYIEMLCDAGYVKGVTMQRYIDGGVSLDVSEIRITLKGLEYLSENTIMQRMYKKTKGITDVVTDVIPKLIP